MTSQNDGLFLLEVLVDKVILKKSPCFSDKNFRTCVNIECLAGEPLEICDDDVGTCSSKAGGPFVKNFNNGKSCLFSLKEAQIQAAMTNFPVNITVFKSLPCGCLPTKIILGTATIDLTKEFVEARQRFLEDPNNVSYQALKDSFHIIAPDGEESGEVVMFLRISCFGKLIVTRFQGSCGPPHLPAGGTSSGLIDRSCNPPKSYQATEDPCACGAARSKHGAPCANLGVSGFGGGHGTCPVDQDPFNSKPCEDYDPCYCSGPKAAAKQPVACRNTDAYCLHLPKDSIPEMPDDRDLTKKQKQEISAMYNEEEWPSFDKSITPKPENQLESAFTDPSALKECLRNVIYYNKLILRTTSHTESLTDFYTLKSVGDVNACASHSTYGGAMDNFIAGSSSCFYREDVTIVCMTMCEFPLCTSGTQATASINKCLQVNFVSNSKKDWMNTNDFDTTSISTSATSGRGLQYQNIYYFEKNNRMGMGKHKKDKSSKPVIVNRAQEQASTNSLGSQTQQRKGVCINEEKCPAAVDNKNDLVALVSHIKIAPKEGCPVHGNNNGQNQPVISNQNENAAVKVTTASNPRRGVFELVVRRMTGAPLAKNELMLEWTPPPCRPPPCHVPCGTPCLLHDHSCRPSKCKMIVCRPTICRPKPCKIPCRMPCRPKPCGAKPCSPKPCGVKPCPPRSCTARPCSSKPCYPLPCNSKPCRRVLCAPPVRVKPCPKPRLRICPPVPTRPCPAKHGSSRCRSCRNACRPCPPICSPCPPVCSPCPTVCSPCPPPNGICCRRPCPSMPCLRRCPIGRGRKRKCRSQPKFKCHRKRISPCLNRTGCPVARCCSVTSPRPCQNSPCPARHCCSAVACQQSSKFFKSECSSCCD